MKRVLVALLLLAVTLPLNASEVSKKLGNLLDLDLAPFILAAKQIYSAKPRIVYGDVAGRVKSVYSYTYYKKYLEQKCNEKEETALEKTRDLFAQFNETIIPPTKTTPIDTITRKSEAAAAFNQVLPSILLEAFGKENRDLLYALFAVAQTGWVISYDSKEGKLTTSDAPSQQELREILTKHLNRAALNKDAYNKFISGKDYQGAFKDSILGKLGFNKQEALNLRDELPTTPPAPTPQENLQRLANALHSLESLKKGS